ncbi:MAG: cyclic-phosphate processing receiver domain-containing protein [bacterium]
MRTYIAILEDDDERAGVMRDRLAESFSQYDYVFFDNAPDMIESLLNHLTSTVLISLDHDLGPNRIRNGEVFNPATGQDVVNYLATQKPLCPVVIHTANYLAAPGMELMLNESGWSCSGVIPVGNLEWIYNAWIHEVRKYLGG